MSLHLLLTRFRFDPGPADRHVGQLLRVCVYSGLHCYTYTHTRARCAVRVHTTISRTRTYEGREGREGIRCKLHPEMQRLAVVVGRLDNTVA